MMVIPREAGRITYSGEIRALKKLPLTEHQRAIVLGCILGDGHLCLNWSKTNYGLRIAQSAKQNKYVAWKYSMLRNFVLTEPRYKEINRSIFFATISHTALTELARHFYRGRIKVVPRNIQQFIHNPLTVAVWFMDDGNCIRRNGRVYGYHLNTQSYTEKENRMLARALEEVHGIRFLLERNHGRYRLRVMRRSDREKFVQLIRGYLLESMRYKIA